MGIMLGLAAKALPGHIAHQFKYCSEFIRDALITVAIFLTAIVVQSRMANMQMANVRRLIGSSSIGAIGLGLGAFVFTGIARGGWSLMVGSNDPLGNEKWSLAADWITVVTNGWIGDSSTQIPVALAVGTTIKERRPNLHLGDGWLALALLWDWIVTLSWFALTFFVAKSGSAESKPPVAQTSVQWRRSSILLTATVAIIGGVVMLYLAHAEKIRGDFIRPLLVIVFYAFVASFGYFLGKRNLVPPDNQLRALTLAAGVGGFGIVAGLGVSVSGLSSELETMSVLLFVSLGALLSHCAALWLVAGMLFGQQRSLLAVASMCSIGGLATAPEVANAYASTHEDSDGIVEAAYLCALWTNLLSLPLTAMVWFVFK